MPRARCLASIALFATLAGISGAASGALLIRGADAAAPCPAPAADALGPARGLARPAPGADPRIARLEADLAAARHRLEAGYVARRAVTVEAARTAYALVEPKLMMSVEALGAGTLVVNYGRARESLAVGQFVDVEHDGLPCFLLLRESLPERAEFLFACEPGAG